MSFWYRALADLVVIAHASYVAFVIFGQLAILVGRLAGWKWVHNVAFRLIHLAAILIVVLEAWGGIICPLTTWEEELRERAGETGAHRDFIARWVHQVLFYDFPPWVFTTAYTLFGAVVLLSMVFIPPRRRRA